MIPGKEQHISKIHIMLAAIFWMATVVCVVVVFYFSQESSVDSSATSQQIMKYLVKIFGDSVTETLVRKGAHVTEFFFLSLFTYLAIFNTNKISVETSYSESSVKIIKSDNEMCIIFTMWFCILNAVVDEYHQLLF